MLTHPRRFSYAALVENHQVEALFPTLARSWESCGALIKRVDFLAQPQIFGNNFQERGLEIYILKQVPTGDSYGQASLGNPELVDNHKAVNTEGSLKRDNMVC